MFSAFIKESTIPATSIDVVEFALDVEDTAILIT
jgi:hypothetical protein